MEVFLLFRHSTENDDLFNQLNVLNLVIINKWRAQRRPQQTIIPAANGISPLELGWNNDQLQVKKLAVFVGAEASFEKSPN